MDNIIKSHFYILNNKTPELAQNIYQWGEWMENNDRHVAFTEISGATISTIFLGIDHNYLCGTPILFESMAFIEGQGEWQERCATYAEAEIMHEQMCQRVKNHLSAAGMTANQIIDGLEMNTYYATISANQSFNGKPGYGYVEIHAENIMQAREKIHNATDQKWAFMYESLDAVHPLDRTKLGEL